MKQKLIFVGIVILFFLGLLLPLGYSEAQSDYDWPVLGLSSCQTGVYHLTLTNIGTMRGHFGYRLHYTTGPTDIGYLEPGESRTVTITLPPPLIAAGVYGWMEMGDHWRELAYAFHHLSPYTSPSCDAAGAASAAGLAPPPGVPGCDQSMPAGIGLVRFVTETAFRWAPDEQALTPYLAEPGQTARLINPVGDYAMIAWGCNVLYVPLAGVVFE